MIPPEKLMILDKDLPLPQTPAGCVYQDFEKDILYALNDALDLIKRYSKLILVFPSLVPYPKEIIKGFRLFSMQHNIQHEIIHEIEEDRSEERRVGKGVSVRVALGGRRIIKKKQIFKESYK